MKNQLFVLLAVLALGLASCTEPAATESADAPDYAAFDAKVELIRSFFQIHCSEDLATLSDMISDDVRWSPPYYNNNEWLGKTEYLSALGGYHEHYDNIKFTEGIVMPDSTAGGFWSGSVFPEEDATSTPGLIRVYGTWTATHAASGQEVGIKYYGIAGFDDDGKIAVYSDYFDLNSLMPQEEEAPAE